MGNRKDALEKGEKTYYSDVACKHCDTHIKYTCNYTCVKCSLAKLENKELMTPYRTREKGNNKQKRWREKNPDKVAQQRMRAKPPRKIWYTNNKEQLNGKRLFRSYGITLDQYNELLLKQNGKCAICHGTNKGKLLAVDHDHKSDKIRGLLCTKCNTGLGLFNDKLELLEKAKEYLICAWR
jgi:hypothetical protein